VRRRLAIIAIGVITMFAAPAGLSGANAAPRVGGVSTQSSSACMGGILGWGICLPALF
jgi:hypothetical protein